MTAVPSTQRALTIALVAGCVALLQWHSMLFWMVHAELGAAGVAWSLLLEGCAMWLWWQRRVVLMVPALVTSSLLLAGPMGQVAHPLMVAISQAETVKFQDSSRVKLLEQEISSMEYSLQTYERNSEKRLGWAERIDAAQAALQQARRQLQVQVSTPADDALPALKFAVMAGQAVALLIFQLVAVLGVLKLSRWSEPVTIATAETARDTSVSHRAVAERLAALAINKGLRGKALAEALGEPAATLHRVSKPDNFTVSADVLARVMMKLEKVG